MRVSVVTISFNQAEFLERTIQSVLQQDYPDTEYIIVDAGSTDGSLDIIQRYHSVFSKVIIEPDKGAADGLNKGFLNATGDIYCFLNSDDTLLPGSISKVVDFFTSHPKYDVIYGHTIVTDAEDRTIRLCFSDKFSAIRAAYNAAFIMQPSTFFTASVFKCVKGFNINNSSNWDGELWIDMALKKAKFKQVDAFLSTYRLHESSITASKKLDDKYQEYSNRMFFKVVNRKKRYFDFILRVFFKLLRYVSNPRDVYQRILKGPIYGRLKS